MRIQLLKDYAPKGEARPRKKGELLTVSDALGKQLIADGVAIEHREPLTSKPKSESEPPPKFEPDESETDEPESEHHE